MDFGFFAMYADLAHGFTNTNHVQSLEKRSSKNCFNSGKPELEIFH